MKRPEAAVWSLLFWVLGTVILASRPPANAGWFIVLGGVAYLAAAVFAFFAIVPEDDR